MAIQDQDMTKPQQVNNTLTNGLSQSNQPKDNQSFGLWGVLNMGSLMGVNLNLTSEGLIKIAAALEETYKTMALTGFSIKVLPIDRNKEPSLYYSSIAVCVSLASGGPITYHLALLEDSNEPLQPRIETINGNQIQIDRLPSDVFDNDYQRIANAVVQRAFGNSELHVCSGQIIFKGFDVTNKTMLHSTALNAVKPPLMDVITKSPEFVEMDLSKYTRDANLNVNLDFNNTSTTTKSDYADQPVRSPISIKLVGSSNQRANPNTINSSEQSVVVSEMGGFMDLVPLPPEQNMNPYMTVQGPRQKFAARFVITNLENRLLMTIPSQLLALATGLSLREGTNWFPAFAPKASGKGTDITDIGSLNYEANVFNSPTEFGEYIDTKAAKFTNQELGQFLTQAIRPGVIYSLDVSMCGSDTWYNEVFLAAAMGDSSAIGAIVSAATKLTGGIFAKHWNNSDSPVLVNNDIVQLGYYINKDGQKRDIREIDYLAVANLLGGKHPTKMYDWTQTWLNEAFPLVQRLDARRRMITELVGGDVRFTGYARRVTFTNKFLDVLIMSCREAGLEMRINSNMLGIDYNTQRSTWMNFEGTAVLPGVNNFFQQGMPGQQAFNNYQFGGRTYNGW